MATSYAEIAQARKLSKEQIRAAIDEGILGAEAARRAGLLDVVLDPDEQPKALAELEGRSVDISLDYPKETTRPRTGSSRGLPRRWRRSR